MLLRGYPAYAGIDLERPRDHVPHRGLPRIRGDRPPAGVGATDYGKATPHTRGSTLSKGDDRMTVLGYPAYAGIDLLHQVDAIEAWGLPRIRGDRPSYLTRPKNRKRATPHTRGSTPLSLERHLRDRGYPAYAGIDPLEYHANNFPWGLPRIRGDRPKYGLLPLQQLLATPHTRGSTYLRDLLYPLSTGYPAYAGIDPPILLVE